MRVGILTQFYPPEIGAPQARLSSLARSLRDRGHDVVVLTAMPNYPTGKVFEGYRGFVRDETLDSIRVIRSWIWPSKDASIRKRLPSYLSFMVSSFIVGLFKLPRLDYLIVESPPLFLSVSGFLLSKIKGARWVLNVSDLWPESAVALGFTESRVLLALARTLERFCYRSASVVSGQTTEIIETVSDTVAGTKTVHFPNGVDVEAFDVRSTATVDPAVCRFAYVGLHGLAQGLDDVLDAIHRVGGRNDVHFEFVGDGPLKAELVAEASRRQLANVAFHPPIPHGEVPAVLARSDVALVPLKTEIRGAIPSKVYEAMAAGCAILLVAGGEAADLVGAAGAGVVVAPGDPAKIADAMVVLISDREARARMGVAGHEFVTRFDRRVLNLGFIAHLERLNADGEI